MLYEFSRKLHAFTTNTKRNPASQAMEQTIAAERRQKPLRK